MLRRFSNVFFHFCISVPQHTLSKFIARHTHKAVYMGNFFYTFASFVAAHFATTMPSLSLSSSLFVQEGFWNAPAHKGYLWTKCERYAKVRFDRRFPNSQPFLKSKLSNDTKGGNEYLSQRQYLGGDMLLQACSQEEKD